MVYALKRRKTIYTSPTEHQLQSLPKAESQLSAIQPLRRYSLPPSAVLSLSLNLYGLFLFIFLGFHSFFLGSFGS